MTRTAWRILVTVLVLAAQTSFAEAPPAVTPCGDATPAGEMSVIASFGRSHIQGPMPLTWELSFPQKGVFSGAVSLYGSDCRVLSIENLVEIDTLLQFLLFV